MRVVSSVFLALATMATVQAAEACKLPHPSDIERKACSSEGAIQKTCEGKCLIQFTCLSKYISTDTGKEVILPKPIWITPGWHVCHLADECKENVD